MITATRQYSLKSNPTYSMVVWLLDDGTMVDPYSITSWIPTDAYELTKELPGDVLNENQKGIRIK